MWTNLGFEVGWTWLRLTPGGFRTGLDRLGVLSDLVIYPFDLEKKSTLSAKFDPSHLTSCNGGHIGRELPVAHSWVGSSRRKTLAITSDKL